MPENRKIIKVFLASPGDLGEERSAAKTVIDDINDDFSEVLGCLTELVAWEDTLPGPGRPQEVINRDLDCCDLFVGMLWKRWGMHPGGSGEYTSGFEEEYSRSIARYQFQGKPYITLLFKEIEPSALADPGPQLKRVLEFKEKIFSERKLLAGSFADRFTFEKKLRKCVIRYITDLTHKAQDGAAQKEQAPLPKVDDTFNAESSATTSEKALRSPLSIQGARFLRGFVTQTEQLPDGATLEATDVARLRLLGVIAGVSANDVETLSSHDANLLFRARDKFDYGRPELIGLLNVGLEQFRYENVPLWHWVTAVTGSFDSSIIQLSTLIGPAPRRVNALLAMHSIGLKIKEKPDLTRADLVGFWLSDNSTNDLKVAALKYLADFGHPSDLPWIQQEYQRNTSQTANAAVNAILWITSRNDRPHALELVDELQPASIHAELLQALFNNPIEITDGKLSSFVKHRNADVRKRAVKTMRERGKLDETQAESLLNDVDADVRYEALKCLTKAGRAFTLDNAKNILIKPVLTGLLPSGLQKDAAGEALFKHFQREFVKNLPETQLESDADSEFSNQNAFFALVLKDYAKRKSDLQAAIQDDFAERYTLILDGIVKKIGASELTERIRAQGKSLCKDYTRQGLDIICEKQDIEDLPFVRSILDKGAVSHSAVDFRYLGKHGQWRDIQLIINLLSTTYENKNTLSLMAISDLSIVEEATHAILKLGKQRASDLIGLAMPHGLLASLVAKIPDRIFLDLTDAQIKPLVYFENDAVRKNAAQKYIRVFNKKRIKAFLQDYMAAPFFFYNVIHWLDLGATCPKGHVLKATARSQ